MLTVPHAAPNGSLYFLTALHLSPSAQGWGLTGHSVLAAIEHTMHEAEQHLRFVPTAT